MKHKRFSQQFKDECIAYAIAYPDRPLKQLAAELAVGYSTLDKWVRQAKNAAVPGAQRTLSAEQQRIKQLEKELALQREVNEILKKATVYFANNPNR